MRPRATFDCITRLQHRAGVSSGLDMDFGPCCIIVPLATYPRHEDRSGGRQMSKYDPGLIYDVGMNNGDDTAYYLRRGFSVVAIEPNPALVASASERFRREIKVGRLTILNVGVAAENGELVAFGELAFI
jgi:hypothetical protein